MMSFLPKLS
jgi:hypothetical protein